MNGRVPWFSALGAQHRAPITERLDGPFYRQATRKELIEQERRERERLAAFSAAHSQKEPS